MKAISQIQKDTDEKVVEKSKKVLDKPKQLIYNEYRVKQKKETHSITGCGSAWLERLVWDQEVAGSNPVTPIEIGIFHISNVRV